MGKKKRKQEPEATPEFKINPFSGMTLPKVDGPAKPEPPPKPEPEPEPVDPDGLPRAFTQSMIYVHLEKKGRGGKMVTLLSGFQVDYELEMQIVVGELRKKLGTGGTLVGDTIELQGDMRLKSARFLAEKGFRLKGELS